MCSTPLLALSDFSKPFVLGTDATLEQYGQFSCKREANFLPELGVGAKEPGAFYI